MSDAPPVASTPTIPQLWSSSLQETRSHIKIGAVSDDVILPVPTTMKTITQHKAFQYTAAALVVFLLSFVILVSIRPPFTYTKSEDKHKTNTFSVGKAAAYAAGATGIAIIVTIVIYIVLHTQAKKSSS